MKHTKDQINWGQIFSPRAIIFNNLGVAAAVIALRGFMIPNHFLDGGITGISILIHEIFEKFHLYPPYLVENFNIEYFAISIVLILLNIPFVYMGYKKVGKTFALQTGFAVLVLALALLLPIPEIYHKDPILVAIFGGFLIGLGMGLVIRGGGVIDGMEVIVHHTQKRLGLSSGEMVLFINSSIFLTAAIFLGIEVAMYSILTYFTAVKTTEYVVDGFEEFIAMNVISQESEEVKRIIVKDFNKAISIYKGERGFLPDSFHVSHDCDIIVAIVSRLEMYRIEKAIKAEDPKAFIYVQRIKEVKGGVGKHTAKH